MGRSSSAISGTWRGEYCACVNLSLINRGYSPLVGGYGASLSPFGNTKAMKQHKKVSSKFISIVFGYLKIPFFSSPFVFFCFFQRKKRNGG